jgi:hypothetical protein
MAEYPDQRSQSMAAWGSGRPNIATFVEVDVSTPQSGAEKKVMRLVAPGPLKDIDSDRTDHDSRKGISWDLDCQILAGPDALRTQPRQAREERKVTSQVRADRNR